MWNEAGPYLFDFFLLGTLAKNCLIKEVISLDLNWVHEDEQVT
jgi:hypothetical protein